MNDKKLMVYKSNHLIESAYKLNLNEQRVLLICIGMITSNEPMSINDKFEVSAKNFAKIFDIDERGAYDQLRDVAISLHSRKITIHDNKKLITTSWISGFVEYKDNTGIIELWFSQLILPYLADLKSQFTRYDLSNISGMSSIYGIRLYELLMQWRTKGKREIEISWLKERFEIANNYNSISDLKKYVINPAVNNINNVSNLNVTHTYRKTGRTVSHITFEFNEKKVASILTPTSAKPQKNRKPDDVKIDNFEHFAQMRQRYGDAAPVPPEYIELLKAAGKW
jgi:plasmid replication initiation protein